MKRLNQLFFILLVIVACSCKKEKKLNPIVGTWTFKSQTYDYYKNDIKLSGFETDIDYAYKLKFNEDGTGSGGRWLEKINDFDPQYIYEGYFDFKYSVSNNTLISDQEYKRLQGGPVKNHFTPEILILNNTSLVYQYKETVECPGGDCHHDLTIITESFTK